MSFAVLAAVAVYLLVVLVLGVWAARGQQPIADDYFLAGRRLPWWAVGGSLAAADAGTGHFLPLLGLVGAAYVFGLAPAALDWVGVLAFSLLVWILLPYLYRRRVFTLPELLEARYGPGIRAWVSLLSLVFLVLVVLAPAWYLAGSVVYELGFGGDASGPSLGLASCIAGVAAVTAVYCVAGGLAAVTWVGLVQTLLLLAGGLVLVLLGASQAGGIAEVVRANTAAEGAARLHVVKPIDHPVLPWSGVAAVWLALATWYVAGNQLFVQRCLGARSEWDAKIGALAAAALRIVLVLLIVGAGLVAFGRFGSGRPPQEVAIALIEGLASPAARAIVAVGLVAALMSAAGAALSAAAALWAFDFHQRAIDSAASEAALVRVGRIATVVVALLGAAVAPLLAWLSGGLVHWLNDLAAVVAPAVSVVLLAGVFWRRAHGRAAAFTLVAGILVAAALWGLSVALWSFHTIDFGDPAVRQRVAEDPVIQKRLQENEQYQARQLEIMQELADPVVRRLLEDDAELRAEFARQPELREKLAEDPLIWRAIADDEEIAERLSADPAVVRHSAEKRLSGWLPFLTPDQLDAAVSSLAVLRSRLNRAAASWAACLVLLILSTLIIRQDPRERYDPDTIWSPGFARLPAHERDLGAGARSVLFWWVVLMLVAGGLLVALR